MKFNQQFLPYAGAIAVAAIALLLTLWLEPFLPRTLGAFFYIAIIGSAWYGGWRPGSLTLALSTLAINYFFISPRYQLGFEQPKDVFELGIFLLAGLTSELVTSNFRASKQLAQENAALLRMASSAAQMGMWNWEIATGQVQWSPDHELLFGLMPGTFDGKYETATACLHPDDRPLVNQALQQAIQNNSLYQQEFRVVWADGSIHWIEARGHAFYNEAGQPIQMIGTATAIDERKQAQGLLQQKFEQQRLVMEVTQRIRQSLNLEDILQTTVEEVRQLLKCDRVIIFQFAPNWSGTVVVESVGSDWMAILSTEIYDPCFGENYVEPYKQGLVTVKSDIYNAGIDPCHLELLASFQVRANLVVPIIKGGELWGLLIAHHCAAPRQWQSSEIDLMQQLAAQVSIALQQSELFEQVQTELTERQQAEATLREREAILRLFAQYAPAGIAMLDREMRYIIASQRWIEDYGLDAIEFLMHRSHYEIFPEISEQWRQIHQGCLAGAIEKCEEDRFVRANGTQQWLSWEIRPWHTATGEIGGILIFALDITDRKQAEIALRENQIQLQRQLTEIETIYQSAPIGLNVLDTELRFVRINQRLAEMNGLSVEAHIGRTIREILPDLADTAEPLLRSILETGEPILNIEITGETPAQPGVQRTWLESFLPLKEGDTLDGTRSDRIIGISTVCEEITERKQAEMALQQLNAELEQRVADRTAQLREVNDRLLETVREQQHTQLILLEQAQLLDLAHDTIMTRDLNGAITFWNKGAEQMYGWTQAEALGQETLTFLHTQFPQPLAAIELELRERGYWEGELVHTRKDGSSITVASRWVMQKDEMGRPVKVLEINNDISDRKHAEQMLELQAVITRNMAEGICLVRADNGVIVYANPKFEQMFGYDCGELNGQHVSIVNYASDGVTAEDVNQAIRSAVLQSGEFTYEVHNVKKDGTPFWCSATTSVFRHPNYGDVLVAVHQDISERQAALRERKQAEEALRESEAKFRSLSDSSPIGIFMTDIQGQYIYTNPRYQAICGCTFDELLGEGYVQFIHPEDREEVLDKWSKAISQKQEFSGEFRCLNQEGMIRFVRVRTASIVSVSNQWIGYVGTVEDITESREVEVLKNEFISIVSHELRTPLTSIRGSLGLLAAGVFKNKPESAQKMLDIAAHDTERLVRLVNDILDLERLEAHKIKLNKQWCDVAILLQQSVKTVQSLAAESNITLSVESTSIQVWVDGDRIIQTLVNLVSNAIKFSPANTTVTLSIQDQAERVLFQVKDQGRGIPADKLESIFGRFQQVDASDSRQKGGTGLGLAICKSIVQQQGGKIWVESVLGEGSSFYFTLPKLLD